MCLWCLKGVMVMSLEVLMLELESLNETVECQYILIQLTYESCNVQCTNRIDQRATDNGSNEW